jgi:phage regulator Rha-like protein
MTVQKPSYKFATNEGDVKFLQFIRARLIMHGDDPNIDFIRTLDKMIEGWDEMRQKCYENGYAEAQTASAKEMDRLVAQIEQQDSHISTLLEEYNVEKSMVRGMTSVIHTIAKKLGEQE